jgi:hypothetical protein
MVSAQAEQPSTDSEGRPSYNAYNAPLKSSGTLRWLPYEEYTTPAKKSYADVRVVQHTTPVPSTVRATRNTPTPATRPAPAAPNEIRNDEPDRAATLSPIPAADLNQPLAETPEETPFPGDSAGRSNDYRSEPTSPSPARGGNRSSDNPAQGWVPSPRTYSTPDRTDGPNAESYLSHGDGSSALYVRKCPSYKDLKPMSKISADIRKVKGAVPKDCPWSEEDTYVARSWKPLTYTWTASALCYKPLYFEDAHLERYGHSVGPILQPFASALRFYATVLILPYKMGLELPNECIYPLGYYRPGDCVPYHLDPIPLSVRAAMFEAGAVTAGVLIIP